MIAGQVDMSQVDRKLFSCYGSFQLVMLKFKNLQVSTLPHPLWDLIQFYPVCSYLLDVGKIQMLMFLILHYHSFLLSFLPQSQQSAHLVNNLPLVLVAFDDLGLVLDCLDHVLLLPPLSELTHQQRQVLEGCLADVAHVEYVIGNTLDVIENVGQDYRWLRVSDALLNEPADIDIIKGGEVKIVRIDVLQHLRINFHRESLELFWEVGYDVE